MRSLCLVALAAAWCTVACGARTFVRLDEDGSGSGESGGDTTHGDTGTYTTLDGTGDGDGDGDGTGTSTSTSDPTASDSAEVDVDTGPALDVGCGMACCEQSPDDDPCLSCVKQRCCEQLLACVDDPACACMLDCLGNGGSPFECAPMCNYSPMDQTLPQLGDCANQNCGNFCP